MFDEQAGFDDSFQRADVFVWQLVLAPGP